MTAYPTALPLYQFFDANGDPLVGGKLYSYEAGTTTPLATYTDSTGTVPNTNPIILDSNGQCQMWLGLDSYKFNLTDSSDVQQDGWPLDNITADNNAQKLSASNGSSLVGFIQSSSAVARTVQDKLREYASVADYGAVGDGITDDTAAILLAINENDMILIPKGFHCLIKGVGSQSADGLKLKSNIVIFGEGWDSQIVQDSTCQYAMSANQYNGGTSSVADNIKNITIRDLAFVNNTGTLSEHMHLLNLNAVSDVLIENCLFKGFRGDGLYIGSGNQAGIERHNERITVRKCCFDGVNQNNRQAISIIDCSGCLIEGNLFRNCTYSTMPGAIDIEFDPGTSIVNTWAIVRDIWIRNNIFSNVGGNVAAVSLVQWRSNSTLTNPVNNINISDNSFTSVRVAVSLGQKELAVSGSTPSIDAIVSGNKCYSASAWAFQIYGIKGVKVSKNSFNGSNVCMIGYSGATDKNMDLSIDGNTLNGYGLSIYSVDRLLLNNNMFMDCAGNAVLFASGTSSYVEWRGNIVASPAAVTSAAIANSGHTFTPATNIFCGRELLGGYSNAFDSVPTFTPVITGGSTAGTGTYSVQKGRYEIRGKRCKGEIEITWSAHTGAGQIYINLPVAPIANLSFTPILVLSSGITLSAGAQIVGLVYHTGQRIHLYTSNAGTVAAFSVVAAGTLYISFEYEIA